MILRKMSFKGFFEKFTFRSRKDFDDDQDSRKVEKYWKILRKEVVVDRFMFDSAEFDHKVEAAFMIMKRSSEVRDDALKWFESGLKVERERVWRKLMREKNIDLSSAIPYLIKINQADAAWRAMDDMSREYVYEWQRRVNFTILEMFILRHKALPLSKRIKNTLFRKKK